MIIESTNVDLSQKPSFCQTPVISWLDCLAQMPNRSTKEKIKIKKAWEKIYYTMVIA